MRQQRFQGSVFTAGLTHYKKAHVDSACSLFFWRHQFHGNFNFEPHTCSTQPVPPFLLCSNAKNSIVFSLLQSPPLKSTLDRPTWITGDRCVHQAGNPAALFTHWSRSLWFTNETCFVRSGCPVEKRTLFRDFPRSQIVSAVQGGRVVMAVGYSRVVSERSSVKKFCLDQLSECLKRLIALWHSS